MVGGALGVELEEVVVAAVAAIEQKVDHPVLRRPQLKVVHRQAVDSRRPPGVLDSNSSNRYDSSNSLGNSSHACKCFSRVVSD